MHKHTQTGTGIERTTSSDSEGEEYTYLNGSEHRIDSASYFDAYPSIGSQRGAAPTTLTGTNGQSNKQPYHTSRSAHRCPLEVV